MAPVVSRGHSILYFAEHFKEPISVDWQLGGFGDSLVQRYMRVKGVDPRSLEDDCGHQPASGEDDGRDARAGRGRRVA